MTSPSKSRKASYENHLASSSAVNGWILRPFARDWSTALNFFPPGVLGAGFSAATSAACPSRHWDSTWAERFGLRVSFSPNPIQLGRERG